jgi:uncharacterized protein
MKGRAFLVVSMVGLVAMLLVGCGLVARAGGDGSVVPAAGARLQASSSSETVPRTISVNGTGVASSKPDVAFIELGVESINADAAKAIDDNTARMTAVMAVLDEMGLKEKDVQTVNYSMFIEQTKGEPAAGESNVPTEPRYHVINQVRVKLRDLSKAGELLGKTLKAGANSVGGITFGVADPTALEKDARDKALSDAKAKAEQLAAGLGAKVGALRQASEFGGVVSAGPLNRNEAMGLGGGGTVPVSAGELNVTVQVQVVFDIAQ